MKRFITALAAVLLLIPFTAFAADQAEIEKELKELKAQNEELAKKVEKIEKTATRAAQPSPITLGGAYQFRFDSITGKVPDYMSMGGPVKGYTLKNNSLMTNKFDLDIKARATQDITVKGKLTMYKVWGHQSTAPVTGNSLFADRMFAFDGNASHIPQDSTVRVDQIFATWSNIGNAPVWFSIGRRPSTGGRPTNLRHNHDKYDSSGTPGLLVDYAFDGLTLGVAPDIEKLPGAYAKLCYGKGFDSGFKSPANGLNDVSMLGIDIAGYSTEKIHAEVQWNRAFNIFAVPETNAGNANLGDIDQLGAVVMGKFDNVGPGNLNLFASAAMSSTSPNDNLYAGMAGLMYDAGDKKDRTGSAYYIGARYDIKSCNTKIGAEYNHGSQYWITFTPAADDMLTSKLGTRGSVYELYVIHELKQNPVSKDGKAFFKLGFQQYTFDYTSSSNWVGAPKSISDVNTPAGTQMFAPVKEAQNVYMTFNVEF